MTSLTGIRQATIMVSVVVFLIVCGCVGSNDPRTAIEKVQANYSNWLQANPDAGEKSIYKSLINKQYDAAIKECEKLRALRPGDTGLYLLEGYAYYKKKDYSMSNDRFSHIIGADKSRGDAYLFRGINYLWLKKPKEALNDINKALDNKQTPDQVLKLYRDIGFKQTTTENIYELIHREKASAHYRLGELQPAMENVNKAIKYNSRSGGLYSFRGQINFAQQKYHQSYKDFEKSVKITPNNAMAWNFMGVINFINGNYINALTQYQKANELNPKDMRILINMSLSYWLQGNQVKAFETMGKVLRENPGTVTFYHFAYFHHLNGDQEKARSNFKKAQELNPDILEMRTTLLNRTPVSSPTRKFYQDELKVAKTYLEAEKTPIVIANETRAPAIEIIDLTLEPDPVPVNRKFDFHVKFKADIPGSADNKITTIFYFKILQKNKILFTSKLIPIKVNSGKINTRTQHMNPVPAKGAYTIKVFVKYKDLLAEKNIELIIF